MIVIFLSDTYININNKTEFLWARLLYIQRNVREVSDQYMKTNCKYSSKIFAEADFVSVL